MNTDNVADVVVVGAGPVGLFTSLLLARQGIPVTIVERYPSPLQAPKAHVINSRSLELFRGAGIDVGKLRSEATPLEDSRHVRFRRTLAGREYGSVLYEKQDSEVLDFTPTPLMSLPQPKLEELLGEQVAAEPLIEVRREHIWRSAEQNDGRCQSTIEAEGGPYILDSRYLLACDGAGSSVRDALGVAMVGSSEGQSCLNIHFHANLRHLARDRPAIIYWIINPEIAGALIAHDIDNSWVFLVFEGIGSKTSDEPEAILRSVIGEDAVFEIQRSVPWTMTAEVAEQYRSGNIFLVGDAAHRFPPAGGLGMNTGLQDAHNLVWKLAAVMKGWADQALLDTYEAERQAIAMANSNQSLSNIETGPRLAMAMMAAATFGDAELPPEIRKELDDAIVANSITFDNFGLHLGFSYDPENPIPAQPGLFIPRAKPGDRLPHAWIGSIEEGRSVLDLLEGDRFTLLVGGIGGIDLNDAADALRPIPLAVVEAQGFPAQWLEMAGLDREALLLIRPDGHVLARAEGNDRTAARSLRTALNKLCGMSTLATSPD